MTIMHFVSCYSTCTARLLCKFEIPGTHTHSFVFAHTPLHQSMARVSSRTGDPVGGTQGSDVVEYFKTRDDR